MGVGFEFELGSSWFLIRYGFGSTAVKTFYLSKLNKFEWLGLGLGLGLADSLTW